MTETISSAVAKRETGPEAQIRTYRNDFAIVLPSHIKPDTWVRVAQGLLRRNEKLREVAERNVGSFLAALMDCARLGLEPGETYHFVPFGDEIVGIEDYKGLIELIYRAGAVTSVKAEIIYEHDDYHYDPDEMIRPRHRPSALKTGRSNWFAKREDRGEMVGAYCYCEMKDGGISRVVHMAEWEIDEHKVVSKTWRRADSMWQKWPRSAWLKTVVKELEKWVPSSPEYITHKLKAERLDTEPGPQLSVAARQLPTPARDYDPELVTAEAEVIDQPAAVPSDPPVDPGPAEPPEPTEPGSGIDWDAAIAEAVGNGDLASLADLWETAKHTEGGNTALAQQIRAAVEQVKTAADEAVAHKPEPTRRELERHLFAILGEADVRDTDPNGRERRLLICSRLLTIMPVIGSTKELSDTQLAQINAALLRYQERGQLESTLANWTVPTAPETENGS